MKSSVTTFLFVFCSFFFIKAQDHAERAFFGAHSNAVSGKKAKKLNFPEPNGVYLTNIIGNTAAEKAGFQPFDYVYQIGEYKFESHQSLRQMMVNFQPDEEATVYFIRDGEIKQEDVVFGKKSDAEYRKRDRSEDPFLGVENNHNGVPGNKNGVRVNIIENSTAEEMGLQDDDIITEINGYPMIDWHDMGTAIDALEVGEEIKVTYLRENTVTTVYSPIKSLAATKDGFNHGSYSYSYSYSYKHGNKNENKSNEEEIAMEAPYEEDMEIEMEDMPVEDADKMKVELNIDMPVVQNLRIEELAIFPNPTAAVFNLQFDLPENDEAVVRIFNASGRMVYSNDLGIFSGRFQDRIDLGNEPAGTYFVMIQQGKYSVSKKLIVTRA